jgi:hypothetical protein
MINYVSKWKNKLAAQPSFPANGAVSSRQETLQMIYFLSLACLVIVLLLKKSSLWTGKMCKKLVGIETGRKEMKSLETNANGSGPMVLN